METILHSARSYLHHGSEIGTDSPLARERTLCLLQEQQEGPRKGLVAQPDPQRCRITPLVWYVSLNKWPRLIVSDGC